MGSHVEMATHVDEANVRSCGVLTFMDQAPDKRYGSSPAVGAKSAVKRWNHATVSGRRSSLPAARGTMTVPPFSDAPQPGVLVPLACPECSGTLWETQHGSLVQFRCRIGHAYSEESFLEEQDATIERTLWAAIRLLEERAALDESLAQKAAAEGETQTEWRFRGDAEQHRGKAAALRRVIET